MNQCCNVLLCNFVFLLLISWVPLLWFGHIGAHAPGIIYFLSCLSCSLLNWTSVKPYWFSLLTKDLQGLLCFVNVILCSLVSSSLKLQYGEYGLGWEWGWDLPLDQPFVMLCHRLLRVEFFWVCNQKYCSVASMTLALWSL